MIELTDAEWNVVLTILTKVDPAEIISDAQAIRRKIIAYAQEKQTEQMAAAAESEGQRE